MKNRYFNGFQARVPVENAFKKTLAGVMLEKKEDLQARLIIPKGNAAAAGITIGDDIIEYTKFDYTGKALVSDEMASDLPYIVADKVKEQARMHFIGMGAQMNANDERKITDGKMMPVNVVSLIFRIIAERENDILLNGFTPLNRTGLTSIAGSRTYAVAAGATTGAFTWAGKNGKEIYEDLRLAMTSFITGTKAIFTPRVLLLDETLYLELQKDYNVNDGTKSILSVIEGTNWFGSIRSVRGLRDSLSNNAAALIMDNTVENLMWLEIMPVNVTQSWPVARDTMYAIEERISEVIPFFPESIMEITGVV